MAAPASFDVADIYQEHAYLVRLSKGRDGKVQVFEVFGRPPTDHEQNGHPRPSCVARLRVRCGT